MFRIHVWGGSGSADQCLLLVDSYPDSGPAIYVIELLDAS